MDNEGFIHRVIVDALQRKLSRDYREIVVNPHGDPDITLGNHGLVLAVVEVETEATISPEKAQKWRSMALAGTKLILMIPKAARSRVMEILWQEGIAEKVSVGTYEIAINMP
jgi:hypothetical protein